MSCQPIRSRSLRPGFAAAAVFASLSLCGPAVAGSIAVAWDQVGDADLAGYQVFVGTTPGGSDQTRLDVGRATSIVLTGLPDCVQLFVGVKAVDLAGNASPDFSGFIRGMTQPRVTRVTPSRLEQGDEAVVLEIEGAGFTPGMQRTDLAFDDPDLRVLALDFVSCTSVQVEVSVGPFLSAPGDPGYTGSGGSVEEVDPVEIGARGVSLAAPDESGDSVRGGTPGVLTVDLLASRADADGSGRVDGWDLARLSRAFGTDRDAGEGYDPGVDLDGDKAVDGVDLSILADVFTAAF